ncbi:MAG TPA: 3-oxoacyl-ACP reductase FabG [Bacteroidia bacterium]|jgi:3-oxoacyl-[acyl-carrier protein] reductase|nr:3-oxoacyl-ACP reductase FabG [Bacteroidia bacterium]
MSYALVTGGSRGIGRACCIKLAEMGYNILINYTSNDDEAKKTQEAVKAKGVDAVLMKFDVSNMEAVDKAVGGWIETQKDKPITVLVNNAGINKDNLMVLMNPEDWHRVMDIAVNGFYFVSRLVVKDMLHKRKGRVVNVVSLSGLKGLPGQTNYSASKGAVIAATKALAQEVAKRGITVNAVAPGFIKTDMTASLPEAQLKAMVPMQRFGEAEEVANVVGFLASDEASYITAQVISVNGGLYS